MRGDETMDVRLVSTLSSTGDRAIRFRFGNTQYEAANSIGDTLWLKLVRLNHKIQGYFSNDGSEWTQVGQTVDISVIDSYSDFSTFTGTRQGLYVNGVQNCWFDLYMYRDAYTPLLAECPANRLGVSRTVQNADTTVLDNIYNNNWAMYAGVEFGNSDYRKSADSIFVVASSANSGGTVGIYIDSIDASRKIGECNITGTGSWTTSRTFSAKLSSPVSGNHDVYLLFTGSGSDKLLMLQSFYFTGERTTTGVSGEIPNGPRNYDLGQNYPNPFNPTTTIRYQLPVSGAVSLKVYNLLGQVMSDLYEGFRPAGKYQATLNGEGLSSGVYLYELKVGNFVTSKKALLLK